MKIKRVSYIALAAFAFAASCTKEAAEPDVYDWTDGRIHIRPTISEVAGSRAEDMTLDRLESFQVTCFNIDSVSKINSLGFITPYFDNVSFIRKPNLTYESSPAYGPIDWPDNHSLLRFLAFSPSIDTMSAGIADKTLFRLNNRSIPSADGKTVSVVYSLDNFRINRDISKQIDFVTADASVRRYERVTEPSGKVNVIYTETVDLGFSHRLSQVELRAWGAESYEFFIAGVRIGNLVTEGSFVFADGNQGPGWRLSGDGVKDKVEYIYRGDGNPEVGDSIFRINNKEHNTLETAASIMGEGGSAMVLPTCNPKWEVRDEPNIGNTSYKTDKMYFSILIRVMYPNKKFPVYPYPDRDSGMKVISFAVDKYGIIKKRLYSGKKDGEWKYYTDEQLTIAYEAEEGIEIMDFGWAAVPVDVDWKPGKKYVYTLDYSDGIGLHDPSDPEPGKPISGKATVSMNVSVEDWKYADGEDNPNVTVPRK